VAAAGPHCAVQLVGPGFNQALPPVKACERQLHLFLTKELSGVSGQLHATAALTLEKVRLVPVGQ
jgi:hypothetical protein